MQGRGVGPLESMNEHKKLPQTTHHKTQDTKHKPQTTHHKLRSTKYKNIDLTPKTHAAELLERRGGWRFEPTCELKPQTAKHKPQPHTPKNIRNTDPFTPTPTFSSVGRGVIGEDRGRVGFEPTCELKPQATHHKPQNARHKTQHPRPCTQKSHREIVGEERGLAFRADV